MGPNSHLFHPVFITKSAKDNNSLLAANCLHSASTASLINIARKPMQAKEINEKKELSKIVTD